MKRRPPPTTIIKDTESTIDSEQTPPDNHTDNSPSNSGDSADETQSDDQESLPGKDTSSSLSDSKNSTSETSSTNSVQEPSEPSETETTNVSAASPSQRAVTRVTQDVVNNASEVTALLAATSDNIAPHAESWTTAGDYQILGGIKGSSTSGDYYNDGSILHIRSSTPLTLKTSGETSQTIQIEPGVHANLTFAGITVVSKKAPALNMITNINDTATGARATSADQIRNKTTLHITIADGTRNRLQCSSTTWSTVWEGYPGLRCGWGSEVTIDDSILNEDQEGNTIIPVNGKIGSDATLSNGTTIKAGDSLSVLDASNPGWLNIYGGSGCAGLGSGPKENAGKITINGGRINAYALQQLGGSATKYPTNSHQSTGAGIGGGFGGSGTSITINSGVVYANASSCGAAIGAGFGFGVTKSHASNVSPHSDAIAVPEGEANSHSYSWYGVVSKDFASTVNGEPDGTAAGTIAYHTVAGDITINGGYVRAENGGHGNAIGESCTDGPNSNKDHVIKITGGTVNIIMNVGHNTPMIYELGARLGYTVITGGSVKVTSKDKFQGIGDTAFNTDGVSSWDDVTALGGTLPDNDKVEMIEVDLSPDIGNEYFLIESWKLLVNGEERVYGEPDRLINGKLYLWLPEEDAKKTVEIQLSYIDGSGNIVKVEPVETHPETGSPLAKRWIKFPLDESKFPDGLTKTYDGLPFKSWSLSENPVSVTTSTATRDLNDDSKVQFLLQTIKEDGTKTEFSSPDKSLPADEGNYYFRMQSTQWSEDPVVSNAYWGHETEGTCVIKPAASAISSLGIAWANGLDINDPQQASNKLRVTVDVSSAPEEAATCKAPTGSVQLYIDGKKLGDPIPLRFSDEPGNKFANTKITTDSDGREHSVLTHVFSATDVASLAGGGSHEITAQYLRGQNYLASASPLEDDEVPSGNFAIDATDPQPSVTPEGKLPDGGKVDTDKPTSDKYNNATIHSTITTTYTPFKEGEENPGRVTLKLDSLNPGSVTVTTKDGTIIDADVVRDEKGEPVRDKDGKFTLIVDPLAAGETQLTVKQEPNGIYAGATFEFDVIVKPNPNIAPTASITKSVENLTHPQGPTQPGDRLRYTLTAQNAAAGSVWNDVTFTDPLPSALTLCEDTVRLESSSEQFSGKLTLATGEIKNVPGQFSVSSTQGKQTITIPIGSVYGLQKSSVTFECLVKTNAVGANLTNVATASGTRPNPEDPDGTGGKDPLPVIPAPTSPVTPPPLDAPVAPADPTDTDIQTTKTVANLTNPDTSFTRIGDTLRYLVTVKNDGSESCCLTQTALSDPLPQGLRIVPGSIRLLDAQGQEHSVSDEAYDESTRTIAVTAGTLWGGQKAILSFDCVVTAEAQTSNLANTAYTHGVKPSQTPNVDTEKEKPGLPITPSDKPETPDNPNKPNEPQAPVLPDRELISSSDPTFPPTVLPDDPQKDDISLEKKAENITSADNATHVGDTLRYTITLTNTNPQAAWLRVVVKDQIPAGVEVLSETISVKLTDGSVVAVSDKAYNSESRILSISCGNLIGASSIQVVFEALVTKDALTSDIGNIATAHGTLPSIFINKGDDGVDYGKPGSPFDPPNDEWNDFASSHEQITSNKAYPSGVTADNTVTPGDNNKGDDGNDDSKATPDTTLNTKPNANENQTISAIRLARTGDATTAGWLMLATIAMCAASIALGTRRRSRRNRS